MAITTGPVGHEGSNEQMQQPTGEIARLDHRLRLSTRWKVVKVAISRRPMMLKADVTVRRPGVRMAPAIRTSTPRKVGAVNDTREGREPAGEDRSGCGRVSWRALTDVRTDRSTPSCGDGLLMPERDRILEGLEAFCQAHDVVVEKRGARLLAAEPAHRRAGGAAAPTDDAEKVQVLWWNGERWKAPVRSARPRCRSTRPSTTSPQSPLSGSTSDPPAPSKLAKVELRRRHNTSAPHP